MHLSIDKCIFYIYNFAKKTISKEQNCMIFYYICNKPMTKNGEIRNAYLN